MNVGEAMSQVVLTADSATTIAEVASLMAQRQVGSALVLDGERLSGIFTERDIVRALSQDVSAAGQGIGHWMTRDPETIAPEASVAQALQRMLDGHFRHLPVVDGDRVVGVISMRDISRLSIGRE